jgi:hypothetical protein
VRFAARRAARAVRAVRRATSLEALAPSRRRVDRACAASDDALNVAATDNTFGTGGTLEVPSASADSSLLFLRHQLGTWLNLAMNPVLWARRLVLLLAVLVVPAIAAACSSTTFVSGNAAPGAAADADGGPAEGGSPRGSCDDYLACTEAVSATPIAPLVEQFGVNGTCWQSDAAATATGCRDACERGLLQLRGQFPEAVACGGTDHDLNPYGARYPTSDIGTTERRGARPGKRIKNFGFQGYLNGKKNELTNVYLASFYDPKQELSPTPIKLLHIQVVAAWVPTAKQESADFQGMAEALRARGVAWLTVVAEGARPGAVATVADLDSWVNSFPRGEGIVLDPAANLSVSFDAAALPLNLWIDARSMEILSSAVGYGGASSLQSEVDAWLTTIEGIPVKP